MSDIEIYESPDGDIRLNVQLEDETVCLSTISSSRASEPNHREGFPV